MGQTQTHANEATEWFLTKKTYVTVEATTVRPDLAVAHEVEAGVQDARITVILGTQDGVEVAEIEEAVMNGSVGMIMTRGSGIDSDRLLSFSLAV